MAWSTASAHVCLGTVAAPAMKRRARRRILRGIYMVKATRTPPGLRDEWPRWPQRSSTRCAPSVAMVAPYGEHEVPRRVPLREPHSLRHDLWQLPEHPGVFVDGMALPARLRSAVQWTPPSTGCRSQSLPLLQVRAYQSYLCDFLPLAGSRSSTSLAMELH